MQRFYLYWMNANGFHKRHAAFSLREDARYLLDRWIDIREDGDKIELKDEETGEAEFF